MHSITPVTSLPDTMSYDETASTLHIGDGSWAPVSMAVWEYEIGMRKVISSWFNYRRRTTTGRVTSELDRITAIDWSPAWTNEVTDLLSVLRRLTDMDPDQRELLAEVVSGELIDSVTLSAAGFAGPRPDERIPRVAGADSDTLDIGI